MSLNPFEFRAGLKRKVASDCGTPLGLNPFEFRAGLKRNQVAQKSLFTPRLNPFEFRAGLKPFKKGVDGLAELVLIPLNSGLA